MWPRPLQRSTLFSAGAAAFVVVASTLAQAQTFVGVGLSDRPPAPQPVPIPASAPSVPALPVVAPTVLRHLPGTLDGLRLDGEIGDLTWPIYLTAAQASAPLRVRVGYLSAVSVLPDSSVMEVRFNARLVATDVIDAPQDMRTLLADLPSDVVKPGYNALTISVRQRHRVDCSVAATYELWTRLNPSVTGIEMPAAAGSITDLGDLPGLLPDLDGSMTIHVILASKTNPAHVQRLIRATQAIALKGRILQPSVTFAPLAPDPYGIDLALGTRAALSQLPRVVEWLGAEGPLVRLIAAPTGGRPLLLVTGSTDDEVDQAITMLTAKTPKLGSAEGLLAAANYPARRAFGGDALRLSDFGVADQDFTGRFFRKSINIELPPDMLASDYGRGTFDLAGGYAAGLASGSQVRVDVNGRSSGIIKLPYADGDVFKHNQLFLPLGLMRPGYNRIDIFAETPRAGDATCAAPEAKRFLFLAASELRLPALARVQRLPDLAATTSGALPFTQGTSHLVVPKPDRDSMAAALSVVARAAVAAGRILPFTFATRMPSVDDGSTLLISPARALDPLVMAQAGLNPASVEKAWRDVDQTSDGKGSSTSVRWWQNDSEHPSACRLAARRSHQSSATRTLPEAISVTSEDLVDTWTTDRGARGWRNALATVERDVASWVEALWNAIPSAGSRQAGADEIASDASLILAQGVAGGEGHAITVMTAPTSEELRSSVGCLFDPQIWSKVHGRLSTINASTGSVVAIDATSFQYRSSGSTSIGNARLVLAGWFSLNPKMFVVTALLLAAWLSGTTFWFVRGVGRRPE